jgi:hypothetical protein
MYAHLGEAAFHGCHTDTGQDARSCKAAVVRGESAPDIADDKQYSSEEIDLHSGYRYQTFAESDQPNATDGTSSVKNAKGNKKERLVVKKCTISTR